MEAHHASFEDNVRHPKQELQYSKHAKVMHIVELRAMVRRLEAGNAAMREAARESEAGDMPR